MMFFKSIHINNLHTFTQQSIHKEDHSNYKIQLFLRYIKRRIKIADL